ncbi:MAG: hypothetical protein QXE05_05890 [Nitrososphaeria archaeon]
MTLLAGCNPTFAPAPPFPLHIRLGCQFDDGTTRKGSSFRQAMSANNVTLLTFHKPI